MKKAKWHDERDQMIIGSGHKTFDRQTNLISTGNLFANTMLGRYIRSSTDTRHWQEGKQHPEGHLREWDLDPWIKHWKIPTYILDRVRRETDGKPIWLYSFFHYGKRGKVIHGYILAEINHTLIGCFTTGPTYKSEWVMNAVKAYVSTDQDEREA